MRTFRAKRLRIYVLAGFIVLWICCPRGTRFHKRHDTSIPQEQDVFELPTLGGDQLNLNPMTNSYFHTWPESNRFVTNDVWRPPQLFGPQRGVRQGQMLGGEQVRISQPILRNFVAKTDHIMLLIKTGAMTMWERLPTHMFTTLTQFPNFALYSDAADSIAGYEVMDILARLDPELLASEQLGLYRHLRELRDTHSYLSLRAAAQRYYYATKDANRHGWTIDKFKNLPMLLHAYQDTKEDPTIDWYVMMDDDTMFVAENLVRFLDTLDPSQPHYLGSAVAGLRHIFAHGGSGIVISRAAMEIAFGGPEAEQNVREYSSRAQHECCGDYMVAAYLEELHGIGLDYMLSDGRFQGEPMGGIQFGPNNWCQEIVSMHHIGAREMEMMWEYERVRQQALAQSGGADLRPLLYRDVYTDFVKPYFPKRPQSDWDNGAKDIELTWQADIEQNPNGDHHSAGWASLENCRGACEARDDCLMYRYDPYRRYCGLGASTIALGSLVGEYSDDYDFEIACEVLTGSRETCAGRNRTDPAHQMVSGWYLGRVIGMRQGMWCDRLYSDTEADGRVHGPRDQVEGWWVRMQNKYAKD